MVLQLQMLVAEAGWDNDDDHAAMLHGIERLAERAHRTVESAMRRHVSEFYFGFPVHRRWIGGLNVECTEPVGFRRDWRRFERLCKRVVRTVRRHNAGALLDPCKGEPDQWRSKRRPQLRRAALRKGWTEVDCGPNTLHWFFDSRGAR